MKRLFIVCALMAGWLHSAKAEDEVDPNFYVYICFGQSNMEGNAQPQSVDKTNVDKRFQLLATCNFSNPSRKMGNWYTATPPLVSPNGGLGPTDYFGRTMVAALPSNVRIGVIPVAMGGSPIEMFDKDKYKQKMKDNPGEWWVTLANNHYGGNPYGRIIDMAKKAQKVGVIKGILLHQGCSNNGDPNWPNMVKKIYNDMLNDLGLAADTVPLFVGETLRQDQGGSCYAHNTQVARMPKVVPTSYVISSEGLPGNGQDPWHFNAVGYRVFGKRYAFKALEVMGKEKKMDPEYQMGSTLKKFYTTKSLNISKDIQVMPGQKEQIPVKATFQDGHTEDVSSEMVYNTTDVTFDANGYLAPQGNEEGDVEAVYTDFTGTETRETVHVSVSYFPMKTDNIKKLSGTFTFDEKTNGFKLGANSQAGWVYDKAVDLSDYKYLVVKLKEPQDIGAEVRISASNSVNVVGYRDTIDTRTTVCIDLNNMLYSNNTKTLSPTKIRMVTLKSVKAGTIYIDEIFLTNDDSYLPTGIYAVADDVTGSHDQTVYNLQGMKVDKNRLTRGLYIKDGKKVIYRR